MSRELSFSHNGDVRPGPPGHCPGLASTIDWFVLVQVVPPVEPARASWRSACARGAWQTEARCTQHATEW